MAYEGDDPKMIEELPFKIIPERSLLTVTVFFWKEQ